MRCWIGIGYASRFIVAHVGGIHRQRRDIRSPFDPPVPLFFIDLGTTTLFWGLCMRIFEVPAGTCSFGRYVAEGRGLAAIDDEAGPEGGRHALRTPVRGESRAS